MTRKELEDLGLEKDKIDSIMALHGKTVESTKSELNAVKSEKEQATAKIAEFEAKLADANSFKTKYETVNNELTTFKQKIKEDTDSNVIKSALTTANVKNADIFLKLLDVKKIVIEDGKIKSGLDEQVNQIKEKESYLFNSVQTGGKLKDQVKNIEAMDNTDLRNLR